MQGAVILYYYLDLPLRVGLSASIFSNKKFEKDFRFNPSGKKQFLGRQQFKKIQYSFSLY